MADPELSVLLLMAVAAFSADGALEKMINLPFGTFPGAAFLGLAARDAGSPRGSRWPAVLVIRTSCRPPASEGTSAVEATFVVCALIALGATARVASPRGERLISFDDYFVSPAENLVAETVLVPDELLVMVERPLVLLDGPARRTALVAPASSPPRPLGSSPLPQHRPHPSYTPPDLVRIWSDKNRFGPLRRSTPPP